MRCALWGLCLVLGVALRPGVEAASRYNVNSVRHSSCAGTLYSLETGLTVERGEQGAPCVGYMLFDAEGATPIRRMCGDAARQPTKAMAQRFCYTLGLNMWRESSTASNANGQIMLYDCDIYQEEGVEYPDATGAGLVAAVEGTFTPEGKFCPDNGNNDFCIDDCHNDDIDTTTVDEEGCFDSGPGTPFWATTCSDIDECHNGVLADCTSACPTSCTKRKACGPNTQCTNLIGGWECECEQGYKAVNDDNARDPYYMGCEDINECEDADVCGPHAQCINKPGYYICICLRPELYDEANNICRTPTCPALPHVYPYATPRTTPPATPVYGDKVRYECHDGYQVYGYESVPASMYTHYGYVSHTSFEVECGYTGHWKPYPLPICVPIKCKQPHYIRNAHWVGSDWHYNSKVTYTCYHGYRPKDHYAYTHGTSFDMTCKDGHWSDVTTCEDIDECVETPGLCGSGKYCINTAGSYMCSCVPWYYKDASSDHCVDYKYNEHGKTTCEWIEKLGLCKYGKCDESYGDGHCVCDPGYEGSTCDRRVDGAAFIMAIIALVLVIIVIIICCICCCVRQRWGGPFPHHHVPGPVVEPTYGVYGARPPGLRYIRKGLY